MYGGGGDVAEDLLVSTASLIAALAGANVRALDQQLARGVGATEEEINERVRKRRRLNEDENKERTFTSERTVTLYHSSLNVALQLMLQLHLPVTIGIAEIKNISMLVGALNKPADLTVILPLTVDKLLRSTNIRKLAGFHGKIGQRIGNLLTPNVVGACGVVDRFVLVYDLGHISNAQINVLGREFICNKKRGFERSGLRT